MKKIILIIGILMLSGCNKQIFDLEYKFNIIKCNYDGDIFELKIEQWNDYEGEQIQIKSDNKTYLLSTNKCYMVKE